MSLSERIKAIRTEKRISQIEVANSLNMEKSNYHRLENRGEKLTIEQLEAIAGALGVSVLELLTGDTQTVQSDERVKELEKRVEECQTKIDSYQRKQWSFWFTSVINIHEEILKKGVELGLFEANENGLKKVLEHFQATIYDPSFLDSGVLEQSILDFYPDDKITIILDELFKLWWFRVIAAYFPSDPKLNEAEAKWRLENKKLLNT